jgi:hypothetical protein
VTAAAHPTSVTPPPAKRGRSGGGGLSFPFKATIALTILTTLTWITTHALAIWCVEINAAGALLSPGGVDDETVLLVGAGFALMRLSTAVLTCFTLALFAAQLTSFAWSKLRP